MASELPLMPVAFKAIVIILSCGAKRNNHHVRQTQTQLPVTAPRGTDAADLRS